MLLCKTLIFLGLGPLLSLLPPQAGGSNKFTSPSLDRKVPKARGGRALVKMSAN